jgi:CRISPR-associated protein Csd1
MTVMSDLVAVYNQNESRAGVFDDRGLTLVPVAHNEINVQLELSLDLDGNFLAARLLAKDVQKTVVPATSKSANRTRKPAAYPLADKLIYVAGDFADTLKGKERDKAIEKHQLYVKELSAWSKNASTEIKAVYTYVMKNNMMSNLLSGSEIQDDAVRKKILNGDWFVRFVVAGVALYREKRFFDEWTTYYLNKMASNPDASFGIDYVTGERVLTTNTVEDGISARDNKAKLVSANDDTAYTYRGLFYGDEFYQLGYVTAQKAMHALGWLIKRQGVYVDNRAFVFWGKAGADSAAVSVLSKMFNQLDGVPQTLKDSVTNAEAERTTTDTATAVASNYRQMLVGKLAEVDDDDLITIAVLDAATIGRMAVVYYTQLSGSRFKSNVSTWGDFARTTRYFGQKRNELTPSFYQIVQLAYQVGSNSSRFKSMAKRAMLNLMTAVVNGTPVQDDLYAAAFRHVTRPTSYTDSKSSGFDGKRWWNDVYNFAALEHYRARKEKQMSEEDVKNDRSYLFGQLLAIADDMENLVVSRQRMRNANVSDRQTTALRYYKNFTEAPVTYWMRIKNAIMDSYSKHLSGYMRGKYLDKMTSIERRIGAFSDKQNVPLSGLFINGFGDERTALQAEQLANKKGNAKND